MKNNLAIVKSENFGQVQCDFWKDEQGNIYMTINQLAQALGYADKSGVEKIVQRNDYLKSEEFSTTDRLSVLEGNREVSREMRVFTEDGIYEVTFLSGTEKAKEFRAWVRKVLKALRKGEAKIVSTTEEKKKLADAKLRNAKVREANILLKLAEKEEISKEYRQVLYSYATAIIADKPLLPLPELEEKTLSAEQIGKILGISANMVGRIAKEHNLKTEQYGKWFHDKSRYSNKEVQSFRYYESIIPVIKAILSREVLS